MILSIHSWSWESDRNNGIRRIPTIPRQLHNKQGRGPSLWARDSEGPDKDGGLGGGCPGRAIKEWDSHGKSGGSQQLQDCIAEDCSRPLRQRPQLATQISSCSS